MHLCVLGAGGLGSIVGARLAEAGVTVSLVARPAHVEAINRRGLEITGISGDRVVRGSLRAFERADEVPGDVDWLALLVKRRDTAAALAGATALRPRIAGAFSLQNSTAKDDDLVRWLGAERVIGASTTEAAVLVGPGAAHHTATAPVSAFYFGELGGQPSTRVTALVTQFGAAGFRAHETTVIHQVEWEKLLQISAVAGFSASTIGFHPGASFAHGIAVRSGAEHYVQLVTELLAVYRALGYEPQDFFAPFSAFRRAGSVSFEDAVQDTLALGADMLARGIIGRPSLHEDLVRRRPTELDDCLGAYLQAAERLDVSTPTLTGAYRVIRTLELLATARPEPDAPEPDEPVSDERVTRA
ncbi:MAG TPA: 2-dehydropantoate 2-reductase N-terminal domain-containing protein [Acidimicrobiales bacterium]|nr:2-dehydropantoate 2-reductase N-terminal domain-containing protein [Acidimicrobiales bacterium]